MRRMRILSYTTGAHSPSSPHTEVDPLRTSSAPAYVLSNVCSSFCWSSPWLLRQLLRPRPTSEVRIAFSKHLNRWTWHKSSCFSPRRRQGCAGIRAAPSAVFLTFATEAMTDLKAFPIDIYGEIFLKSVHSICAFKNISVKWKEYRSHFIK